MTLHPHNDDSRRAGEDTTTMTAAPIPADAAPAKPRRGRPPGVARQNRPGLRAQCWWLMREIKGFTINLLLDTYADGTEKGAHNNVSHYLQHLEACGVVERLARRQPGDALTSPGFVVWRLVRNLGISAPVWRSQQNVLWDPNAGQIVPFKSAQAEQQASQVPFSEPDSHD